MTRNIFVEESRIKFYLTTGNCSRTTPNIFKVILGHSTNIFIERTKTLKFQSTRKLIHFSPILYSLDKHKIRGILNEF